jgi:hypothetical protein
LDNEDQSILDNSLVALVLLVLDILSHLTPDNSLAEPVLLAEFEPVFELWVVDNVDQSILDNSLAEPVLLAEFEPVFELWVADNEDQLIQDNN